MAEKDIVERTLKAIPFLLKEMKGSGKWDEATLNRAIELVEPLCTKATDRLRARAPEGWRLVPVEPTDQMLDAFWRAMFNEPPGESGPVLIGAGYDAMLSASPEPPATEGEGRRIAVLEAALERARGYLADVDRALLPRPSPSPVAKSWFLDIDSVLSATEGWRDISSAPKDGTKVFLYPDLEVGIWCFVQTSSRGWAWRPEDHKHILGGRLFFPTHWMPLPAGPLSASPEPATEGWTNALADVAAERRRQIDVEGWTPEHDDEHSRGELARAAAAYCAIAGNDDETRGHRLRAGWLPATWPWDPSWWKPKDRRRDLVRAAALIVAEIERLDRLSATPAHTGEG